MFDNIGSKIKKLAKILCWLGIIISVISGIAIMAAGNNYSYNSYSSSGSTVGGVVGGILTIVLGSLLSWISSFFAYGFGQLIENTDRIRERND